jgi:hypothetical protein
MKAMKKAFALLICLTVFALSIDAAHQLPSKYPGIKRVWTTNLKYQGQEGFKQAIVMEFESQDALKKYEDSPAQQGWYKIYLPVREESRTHDVTN